MQESFPPDLARLLHPITSDTFFREYWEEKPLLVRRTDPNYYGSLATLQQVDALITVLPPDGVTLINSDVPVNLREFIRPDYSFDVVRACQLFAGGATILVRDAHKRLTSLAVLCRRLEREFAAPLKTNLYLTPARGAGFGAHFDTHDVLLLQLSGSKEWTIFDAPVRLPLSGQRFDANLHPVGEATMSFVLNAGDFLYIPRGFVHSGRSGDATSLHATLGILSYRWADVLMEVMAQVCLYDPDFRRSLPLDLCRRDFDISAARRIVMDLMVRAVEQADPDRVLDRFADEFAVGRPTLIGGQLDKLLLTKENLLPTDRVGIRPTALYRTKITGDAMTVRSQGRELSLPVEAAEAAMFALETENYCARDLPGDLAEDDKLLLVVRLIEEGLVWKLSGG